MTVKLVLNKRVNTIYHIIINKFGNANVFFKQVFFSDIIHHFATAYITSYLPELCCEQNILGWNFPSYTGVLFKIIQKDTTIGYVINVTKFNKIVFSVRDQVCKFKRKLYNFFLSYLPFVMSLIKQCSWCIVKVTLYSNYGL